MPTISYRLAQSDGLYWIEQQIDEEPWTPCVSAPMAYAEAQQVMNRRTAELLGPAQRPEGEAWR